GTHPRRFVLRVYSSETVCWGCPPPPRYVPVSDGLWKPSDLGISARCWLPAPARGWVESRGMDELVKRPSRTTRRRYRRRSDEAPARNRPGARADTRCGARDGRSATRCVAEAGRRGVHTRGAVRGESPFRVGLCAGTDASQSAHTLAGRTVHTRS